MLAASAIVLAIIAAVRGMWSPCGLSMLSTMTPMAERLRGHRFGTTASWFIIGAICGGATLGLLTALGATLVHFAHLSTAGVAVIAVGLSTLSLVADAEIGHVRLPAIRRQVNEQWVERYRPSVYAIGFGWQLGAGLTTYVMTSANYLLVGLAISSGSPVFALAVCCIFGATRGLVILVNAKVTTTKRLFAMHRLLEANAELSKLFALGAQAIVIAVAATMILGAAGVAIGVCAFTLAVLTRRRRTQTLRMKELVTK
jgi:MFS family permease